jgi:hypothetical protein
MGIYYPQSSDPCPPEYSDYEAITPGTLDPDTPAPIVLNTLYRTDFVSPDDAALFSVTLVTGKEYRIACEASATQPSFTWYANGIKYWKPSDWTGDIDDTPTGSIFETEDSGTKWCPYNYKLNEYVVNKWVGGFRMEITATETGVYRVLFHFAVPV